jgi:hypothetical protein
MASCIKINSEEKRRNLVAILCGDVEKVESLLRKNNGKPLPVFDAEWGDDYFYFDSCQLSYVLYDALLYSNDERDYLGRNIPEMLDLHKNICCEISHPDYSNFPFISWNDDDYLDDDEIAILKENGASDIDIELTNAGVQHKEQQVIELLKRGASPYFINLTDYAGTKNKEIHYGYYEVAMLLCHLDSEWCDQWDINGLSLLRKDINTLNNDDLELIVFDLFNAAASQRILYLVDKYITDEARTKGEELMRKYDVYIPILRHKLESDASILNYREGNPNSL